MRSDLNEGSCFDPFIPNVKLALDIQGHGTVEVSFDTIIDELQVKQTTSRSRSQAKRWSLIGEVEFGK